MHAAEFQTALWAPLLAALNKTSLYAPLLHLVPSRPADAPSSRHSPEVSKLAHEASQVAGAGPQQHVARLEVAVRQLGSVQMPERQSDLQQTHVHDLAKDRAVEGPQTCKHGGRQEYDLSH